MFVLLSGRSVYSTEFFGAVSLSWSLFDVFKKGNKTRNSAFFSPTVNSFGMFAHKPLSYWVAGCFGTSSGLRSLHTQLVWSILPRVTVSSRDALHEHFSFFGWILSVWRECISCISYHIQMEEFRNFVLIRTYFQKRFTLKELCRY